MDGLRLLELAAVLLLVGLAAAGAYRLGRRRGAAPGPDARAILEGITDGFFAVDRGWRFTYVNPQAERLLGRAAGELVGRELWDVYPGLAGTEFERLYRRAAADRAAGAATAFYPDHGRWYEVHAYPARGGVSVYFRDVTEAKRAAAALRATDERLALLAGHATDYAIILTDPDGVVTEWLAEAEGITGWSAAEAVGRAADLLFTPDDRAAGVPDREIATACQTGRAEDKRWHLRKDGGRFFADGVTTALRDDGGGLRGFGKVFRDATDRKLGEERLRDSEGRFRAMADAAPVAISVARVGVYLYANRAFRDLYGLRPDLDVVGRRVVDDIAPRDRERIADRIRRRAAGEPVPSVYEFAGRRPDGSEFVATAHVGVIALPDGPASVCFSTDATARRAAEEALRASDERYRAFVAASTEGVWRVEFDPPVDTALPPDEQIAAVYRDGRFAECNDAFARMYGYARAAEVVGRGLDLCLPPDDPEARAYLRAVIAAGYRAADVESAERDRDGNPVYFSNSLAGVVEGGRLVRVWGTQREVTERRRAEAALKASEGRFRLAADAVNGIIYDYDPATGRVERSRGLFEVTGHHPDEVPATAGWWVDQMHPDDRARTLAELTAGPPAGDRAQTAYRVRHRDGRWLHVEDRAALVRGAGGAVARVVGCTIDVTERVRAEEAARASLARLDFVLRSTGIGLWLNPLPLGALNWDERVKAHFFLPPDAAPTLDDFWARLHPDDRPPTARAIDAALAGRGDFDVDYRTVDPATGAVRWVRAIGRPTFAADGTPTHFDGVTLDVTARKQAEEALKDADRRKDVFLATLAHELRNPLAPIRNGLAVLKLAAAPATVEATRAVMDRQLTQMVRLIDDLLDVSRITRGKIDLKPERMDLTAAVRQAAEDARPLAEQAGHALTVDAPAAPVWVDADPTRLAQVVFNLLTNSVKYTHRGGRIRVAVGRRDGAATVAVADTGIGIPADMLGRVFDMFTQVDRALEKTTGGLGIGLSLVKWLVGMHGGTIAVESPGEGQGSTFTVTLPLADRAAQAGRPVPPDAAPGGTGLPACATTNGAAKPAGRKVLVVDDNADAAESLALVLGLLGSEVRTAGDGRAGVAAALGFRPDLILMDIGMPVLNGYDACRQLRADPWGRGAFIVALTGWGQEDDRQKTAAAGFDRHLVKPVDPGAVRALLAEVPAAQ